MFSVIACSIFVYTCYPSHQHLLEHETHILKPIFVSLFGENSWIILHVQTDWLASTWIMFWVTLVWTLGCYILIIYSENDRQYFMWLTSFVDAIIFLVGNAYFCAASYPPICREEHIDFDVAHHEDVEREQILNVIHEELFTWALSQDPKEVVPIDEAPKRSRGRRVSFADESLMTTSSEAQASTKISSSY